MALMLTSPRLSLVSLLVLAAACDPTANRLEAKRLEFSFATHTRSFDHQGNLVLTGFNAPVMVRMNREKLEFQDFSQGLPMNEFPQGEVIADSAGNLAAGGWYRGASDTQWARITAPPVSTRPGPTQGQPLTASAHTFSGAGFVFAVMRDGSDVFELYRMQPPAGAWERVTSVAATVDASTFKARLDGTVFVGDKVLAPGATELVKTVKCPTLRIDQTCDRGLTVFTHPRRNETYLVALAMPGLSQAKLFRLAADAKFPVDYDALTQVEMPNGTWRPVRLSSDGVLHVATLTKVSLEVPPYEADEATLHGVDATGPKAEARLLWYNNLPIVGDHRDIYQASAQLAGSLWVADPVYVWKF